MDFFKMKRKKLQSYCKKHGIPANLKNIEMAERLSLIYQGEENENHVSRQLRSDKNKKPVEIIILDSESDTDVQMEVSDAVADIGRILILDSDSDTDVQMEALGTTGGNADVCELNSASSQKMSRGQEECTKKLQRERSNDNVDMEQIEDDHELSPGTPSDLNVHHIVLDNSLIQCTAAGHVDACEVKSLFSQKMSRGGEDSKMKLTPAVEENVRMSVNTEHIEDYLELHYATPSEGANILEQFGNYMMMGRVEMSSEYTDEHEHTDVHQGSMMEKANLLFVSPMESGGHSVTQRNIGFCDVEGSMQIGFNKEQVDDVQMEASGTAGGNTYGWEVKSAASSQMMSRGREENMQMSAHGDSSGTKKVPAAPSEDENMVERDVEVLSEKADVHEAKISIHQGPIMENVNNEGTSPRSVEQVHNLDDDNCVKAAAAAMCFDASTGAKNTDDNTDVAVEDNLDEVRSSSFEDSGGTPVQVLPTDSTNEVETSDLGHHEMIVTGGDTSGVKFESSQKVNVCPVSEKIIGSSTKLTNNSVTPKDIGFFDVVENMQIGVDEEQVDHSEVKKIDENTVTVEGILNEVHSSSFEDSDGTPVQVLPTDPLTEVEASDLDVHPMVIDSSLIKCRFLPSSGTAAGHVDACEVKSASSWKTSRGGDESQMKLTPERCDNVESFYVDENVELHYAIPSEGVNILEQFGNYMMMGGVEMSGEYTDVREHTDVHQGSILENVNLLYVSPMESSGYSVEQVILQAATTCLDTSSGAKDPLSEVEKSDLDAHKIVTGTATSNAYTSGAKFESSQKMSISPASGEIIDSSTKLLTNSVTPRNIGFCDVLMEASGISKLRAYDYRKANVCDVKSAPLQKLSHGREESKSKSRPEGDDIGSFYEEENMQMSVNKEKNENNQELHPAAPIEDDNMVDVRHEILREKTDVDEETSGTEKVGDEAEKLDEEPDRILTTLSEVKSNHEVDSGTAGGNADAWEVKSESSQMMSRGREDSKIKLAPERDDVGSFYVEEENMKMSVHENSSGTKKVPAAPSEDENIIEKTDVHEDTSETKKVEDEAEKIYQISIHQGPTMENVNHEDSVLSVEQVHNLDDDNCVKVEAAAMCSDASTGAKNTDENTNVAVEGNLDEVRSSSFEDSDQTPVQGLPTDPTNEEETSDLSHHEMVVTGTATTSADTSGVKFESSQKANISPASEKMIVSSTKLTNNSMTPKDVEFFYVEKNMQIGVDEGQVDHSEAKKIDENANVTVENMQIGFFDVHKNMQIGLDEEEVDHSEAKKFDDNANVTVENLQIGFFDVEENMEIGVDEAHVDHSEVKKIDDNGNVTVEDILNEVHSSSFEDSDGTLVQVLPRGREDSKIKSAPERDDVGSFYVKEENMKMSVYEDSSGTKKVPAAPSEDEPTDEPEKIDQISIHQGPIIENVNHEDTSPRLVEQVHNLDDDNCVKAAAATMCFDASTGAENTDENTDVVHSSSFDPLTEVETSDLDVHPMVIDSSLIKCLFLPCSGTAAGHVDACEVKSTSLLKKSRGGEESQMKLTPERSDNVESFYATPSEGVNILEEFGNYMMMGGGVEMSSEYTDVHQGSIMENVNLLHVSPKESSGCSVEEVHKLDVNNCVVNEAAVMSVEQVHKSDDNNCVMDETSAMCFDVLTGAKNTDENTDVAFKDILDEVRLSSFEDSDGTPVQFLPTDQSTEVETSDFDVHEMVVTGAAAKNAYTSEAKFESSQKMNTSPASEKMIGSSTKLKHNPMTPRDIEFCDGKENMRISIDEEEVDLSQVKNFDLNTDVTVEDILNEVHSSSFENSDGKPVRILPTDPSNEVETSDLVVRKMVVTDIFPRKCARDSICTLDMKENFKTNKKEEVGSTISKYKCAKRQPLQDLPQN